MATESKYQEIVLSDVIGVRKPRADNAELKVFEESLSKIGLLQAPVIVPDGKKWRLVAGASRFASLLKAGKSRATCLVFPFPMESPEARLAFVDENLIRKELPSATRDAMWAERQKILAQIDPSTTTLARKAAGGKKAGKGRPADIGGPKTGPPIKPSRESEVRKGAEAAHRKEGSSKKVWGLYAKGDLKQTQVDQIVTLPAETQNEVAQEVVGKTIAETKQIVQAAKKQLENGIDKKLARLLSAFDRLSTSCRGVSLWGGQIVEDAKAIDLEGLSGIEAQITFTEIILAVSVLKDVCEIFKKKGPNDRIQAEPREAEAIASEERNGRSGR